MRIVVDSNVLVTANGGDDSMADCAAVCARFLLSVVEDGLVLLEDASDRVFDEYRRYCSLAGQPGPGDYFLRWYFQNRWTDRVVQVAIPEEPEELADSLPEQLRSLDNDDHKWLAIYLKGSGDAIYNATDSDWGDLASELLAEGVTVVELCA